MSVLSIRNIREMGGLAGKMPITGTASAVAALSIGGVPPFACFISEFFIFMGAFQLIQTDSFYIVPTALMLIAAVLSLAYSLRFISKVFLGPCKISENAENEKKKFEVPRLMQLAMIILTVLVIIIGIYPSFFIELINTATAFI
jgi:NADH:ubiquinone oxidoreductase subunit 5 (subunit L)/multisubunit Na+/H+ antiporter MnhA subunit